MPASARLFPSRGAPSRMRSAPSAMSPRGVVPLARRGLAHASRLARQRGASGASPAARVGTGVSRDRESSWSASPFAPRLARSFLVAPSRRPGLFARDARLVSCSSSRSGEAAEAPAAEALASEAPASEAPASEALASAPSSSFDGDFWRAHVSGPGVRRAARVMAQRLDHADPLGVDLTLRGASSNAAAGKRPGGRKTLYDYALSVKRSHPRKVLLIRVGEFYEALGYDAVVLVMHAGLNPMGTTGVPRAGCPLMKVQETLDRLTHRGFSCVVCEEVPQMNPYGRRAPPKERYVAAVVTPASPQYVVGAAEAGDDVAFDGDPPPPVVAVAATATGYALIAVEPDLRRCVVSEGLTAESVAARLAAGGFAPPLYRHKSLDGGFGARGADAAGVAGQTRRLRVEIGNILEAASREGFGSERHARYDDPDPARGILDVVRREYGLGADAPFEILRGTEENTRRPAPLSLSTAQQLGVLPTRSVPPLLSRVLPGSAGAPAACRAYAQELLLHPPPREVAEAISEAAELLSTLEPVDGGLPTIEIVPPAKIAKLLRTREGSHVFFAELAAMARATRATLEHESAKTRRAAEALLAPTALKVGTAKIEAKTLADACRAAEAIVEAVVAPEALDERDARAGETSVLDAASSALGRDEDETESPSEEDEDDAESTESTSSPYALFGADAPPRVPGVPRLFARINEPWRGRVRRDRVETEVAACEAALHELSAAVEADLAPLVAAADREARERKKTASPSGRGASAGSGTGRAPACTLEHDQRNNALFLRGVPSSVTRSDAATRVGLRRPVDRWGKSIPDRYSTARVDEATEAYRVAASRAGRAVADALRGLADDLAAYCGDLVRASTFGCVTLAVSLHAREARRAGWRRASLLPADDATSPWVMEGLRPFWMRRDEAVPNDLALGGVAVLTGPNMAGKSTVLRSAAAAALLASCGLFVPADRAVVPHFDALVVRMSSTDSPAEGLSSYAVEMAEVGAMLDVVTPRSLVFIDELGRGTEAEHGTAAAGAVVEALDAAGARGVFATHLHGLLDADLILSPFATRVKMETVRDATSRRLDPTWRVVPGECRESLAFQTARDMGVPERVVRRSEELLARSLLSQSEKESAKVGSAGGARPTFSEGGLPAAGFEEGYRGTERAALSGPRRVSRGTDRNQNQNPSDAWTLDALRGVLAETAADALGSSSFDPSTSFGVIGAGESPPASAGAWTCVYVLKRADGWAYCGETDDLAGRLSAHRRSAARDGRRAGTTTTAAVECAFFRVPREAGGKSAARAVEQRVIERLKHAGAPLLSDADAKNASFGSASERL